MRELHARLMAFIAGDGVRIAFFYAALIVFGLILGAIFGTCEAEAQEPDSVVVMVVDTTTNGLMVKPGVMELELRPGDTTYVSGVIVDVLTGDTITAPEFEIRWFTNSEFVTVDQVTGEVVAQDLQGNRKIRATVWGRVLYVGGETPPVEPPPEAAFFDDFGDEAGVCGWEPGVAYGLGHSGSSTIPAEDDGTGNCALAFHFPATALGQDSWEEHRFWFGGRKQAVWVEYDWFVPQNFWMRDDRPGNNKLFRIFTGDGNPPSLGLTNEFSANVHVGREPGTAYTRRTLILAESWAWWPEEDRPTRSDYPLFIGPDSTYLIQPGTWAKLRMYFQTSSAPLMADGRIYREVNGVVIQDNEWAIVNNLSMTTNLGFDLFYLMGWSNNGYDEPTTFYIDNLTVGFGDPGW